MSNQTLQFINKSIQKKDKYNIITFDTHERYQTQLAKTGHNFYIFRYDGCKEWDESYAPMPENHFVMSPNSVQTGIDYDFVISQSKFGQFMITHNMNRIFKLPVISLEHTLPIPSWPIEQLNNFRQQHGDINNLRTSHLWRKLGLSFILRSFLLPLPEASIATAAERCH